MKIADSRIMRQVAGALILLVIMQAAEATAQNGQDSPPAQTEQTAPSDSGPAATQAADGQNASTNHAAQEASDSNANGAQQEQGPAAASQNWTPPSLGYHPTSSA